MNIETLLKRHTSINKLAALLGISRQAVQQYQKRGLPADREAQLRALKPEWFKGRK